jgi:hypothetical protein
MANSYADTDVVVDDLVKKYGSARDTTFTDIVVKFLKGVYSYPDDVGMAVAVSVAGMGLLGPRMEQQALGVCGDMDAIICTVLAHPPNFWYFTTKYMEYLETNGRWKGKLASLAGRRVGAVLTNKALARVQLAAGVDPRYVTRWDRLGVSLSLFVLAMFGAACHAILAGERTFLGLLHRMITGETDLNVGGLELDLRFDAPWRNAIPKNADDLSEIRLWLRSLCRHSKSLRKG